MAITARVIKMARVSKMARITKMVRAAEIARMNNIARFTKQPECPKRPELPKRLTHARLAKDGNMAEMAKIDRRACEVGLAESDKVAKTAKWSEKPK